MNLDWKKNLGNTDRIIRTLIGIVLLGLVLLKIITGFWATLAILIALFQFVEAAFSY